MERWKVLLVDDEPEFTSTLAERLRLRGWMPGLLPVARKRSGSWKTILRTLSCWM